MAKWRCNLKPKSLMKILRQFKIFDLILISLIASLGSASKVVVVPLIKNITSIIGIPGGAIAGGFYMSFLVLAYAVTRVRGAGTLCASIQCFVVMLFGIPGSHGIWSIFTYLLPGIAVDIVFLTSKCHKVNILQFVFATMLANLTGTFGSNLLFFMQPFIPLMLTLSGACLSGMVGGILCYLVYGQLEKLLPKLNIPIFCRSTNENKGQLTQKLTVKQSNKNNDENVNDMEKNTTYGETNEKN